MSQSLNNKDFQKLQAQWYDKLKKTGFEDAEQSNGALKCWSATKFKDTSRVKAKEEYFRLAGHFLH